VGPGHTIHPLFLTVVQVATNLEGTLLLIESILFHFLRPHRGPENLKVNYVLSPSKTRSQDLRSVDKILGREGLCRIHTLSTGRKDNRLASFDDVPALS